MKIELKCSCGATASFDSSTYINGGGAQDEKGDVFVVQRTAREWQSAHRFCVHLPAEASQTPHTAIKPIFGIDSQ